MPTVNNPFTAGTSMGITAPTTRFPEGNALFANSQPTGVPASYGFTFTLAQINAVKAGITQIQKFYTLSSGLITTSPNNNYGMTPTQITALNTVTTYFNSLSAGTVSIPQATLSAIVIVSEMYRAWPYNNFNQYTAAEIAEPYNGTGNILTTSIPTTSASTNMYGETYTVNITNAPLVYATADTGLSFTPTVGGTGSGATLALFSHAGTIQSSGPISANDVGYNNGRIANGGGGYSVGDILTVQPSLIVNSNWPNGYPSGAPAIITVATIQSNPIITLNATNTRFPFYATGATTVVCNDGYAIVEEPNTGNWFISANQDFTTWSALSSAAMETRSDFIQAVDMYAGGIVLIMGSRSMEFWYDAGSSPFPFQRYTGTQIDWGLAAKWSRAYVNGTIAMLAQNYQGQVQIVMMNNYAPQRISTTDIEDIINNFTVVNDAIAQSYIINGHPIYRITFPTANRTFDYDCLTGIWNEAMSGLSYPNRHLTTLGVSYNTCNYASDCVSGSIYYLDPNNYTDNGSYIYRECDTVHIQNDGNEFTIDELFIDMQLSATSQITGDTPTISMSKSIDQGNTFGTPRSTAIGTPGTGVYSAPRVIWRRLGSARDFVLKFTTQSAVPFIVAMGTAVIREGTEK